MITTKTIRQRSSQIIIFLMTASLSAFGSNELKVARTSSNSLDVLLANSDGVSGVQFCIRTSNGIVLESVKPGNRTVTSSWIVDSYTTNDSTINVLVLNSKKQSLSSGSGTLASILFTMVNMKEIKFVQLTNVMVIDEKGDSLGVTITNLFWDDKSFSATNTNESKSFVIGQNFPNPFNPTTFINYRLYKAASVRLSVYDIMGHEVSRLINQYQYPGEYKVKWDSNLNDGQKMASGIYIARLNVDNSSVSQKMLLTK